MNTRELLEFASLDALGLLDENERRDFERAFQEAPESVRAEIRREQLRIATDDALLPDVSPPVGLRERVLGAMRDAMTAVRLRSGMDVLATLGPTSSKRLRVSPVWRAACLAFATATVVLFAFTYTIQADFRRALNASGSADVAETMGELGARFTTAFFSPTSQKVGFASRSADFQGRAAILVDPEEETLLVFCTRLPALDGRYYSLVLLDEAGEAQETIATFTSNGALVSEEVDFNAARLDGNYAIYAPSIDGLPEYPVLHSLSSSAAPGAGA